MRAASSLCMFILLVFIPQGAFACSCREVTPQEYIEYAEVIFSGTVIDVHHQDWFIDTKSTFPYLVFPWDIRYTENTVVVTTVWKGEVTSRTIVRTGGPCNYNLEVGKTYLIYGGGTLDQTGTSCCSNTSELSQATAQLALLGKPRAPRPNFLIGRLTIFRSFGFATASSALLIGLFLMKRVRPVHRLRSRTRSAASDSR